MKKYLSTYCILLLLLAGPGQTETEEEVSYPLTTFKNFRQNVPLPELGESDIKMDMRLLRFSAVVRYRNSSRPLTESKQQTMNLLEATNVFHGKTSFFDHEILIQDELGRELWIPANEGLINRIDETIESDQEFTAGFTYLGCCYGAKDRILFMNRIDFEVQKIPRHTCYTDELLGFKIRSRFEDSLDLARDQFGEPVKTLKNEKAQRVFIFLLDAKTETAIYLRDGGPEFSEYLSSIQISTYQGSTMEVMPGLSFGSGEKEIESAIVRDLRIHRNKNADLLYYQLSPCTFEMREGKLFSIYVAEDPYY